MTFLDLKGRERKLRKAKGSIIDWHKVTRSKFQDATKKFLYPFWKDDQVFEEMRIVGTLMRFDIYNHSKKIVIETAGRQHSQFVKHFHKTRAGFLKQVKRDLLKHDFCEINGISLVEIASEKELTYEYFLSQGVEL
jgi:hypothetical protein